MGIWPKFAKGLDINAIDVSRERGYVVSANDDSFVHIMNFPCVVRNAPRKKFSGHSSHTANVKFFPGGKGLVTVGGKDAAVIVWRLLEKSDKDYRFASLFEKVENQVDNLYNHELHGGGGGGGEDDFPEPELR
jgi:WD40 repeat protein